MRRGAALALAAAALTAALAAILASPTAEASGIVPAVGSYNATGAGDPPAYSIRGQVKRKGGRKVVSIQVSDRCGGFATFPHTAISYPSGVPKFAARVGATEIGGRWTSPTRIEGRVKTPCAARQDYVMRLVG